MAFDQKRYMREYMQRRNAGRREAGLCVACGEAAGGKAKCEGCRAKDTARQKDRQDRLVEQGICKQCGKTPASEGHQYCGPCLEKANAATRRQAAKKRSRGQCVDCGEPCQKSRCAVCQKRSSAVTRAVRQKWTEAGRCRNCGGEAIPSTRSLRADKERSDYCRICYLKVLSSTVLGSGKKWRVILEKLDACDWKCHYTGVPLVLGDNLSFDHLDPVSRFPEKKHDPDNVVPCTWQVNLAKRDATKQEFLALVKSIYWCQIHEGDS